MLAGWILSHGNVFAKGYNALKMVDCRSKVSAVWFCKMTFFKSCVAMTARHFVMALAQVKFYHQEKVEFETDFSQSYNGANFPTLRKVTMRHPMKVTWKNFFNRILAFVLGLSLLYQHRILAVDSFYTDDFNWRFGLKICCFYTELEIGNR